MPDRTNHQWLSDLKNPGPPREAALADLHALVLQAMPYALSRYLSPDNPQFNALAEETAQETLLRVLDRMDTFEGRSQFTTWVYKIAVHIALSELRRRRWRDVSLDELLEDADGQPTEPGWMSTPDPGPETRAEQRDALERVRRIIAEELTDKQRKAVIAIGIKGMPMDEVAKQMRTNRNALYKLMFDARLRLKQRLENEGLEVDELLNLFEV